MFGVLTLIYAKRTLEHRQCISIEKRAAEHIVETTVTVPALPNSDWETFSKEAAAKNYKRLKLISLLDQKKDLLYQTRLLLTIEQSDKQHDCMSLPNYFRFCTKENGTVFFHTQLFITGREKSTTEQKAEAVVKLIELGSE